MCFFPLSITADSARLLSFRRPNRGDLVSFGFVQRVPFCHRRFRLPPFIQAVESWLYCYSSCVCALFDTHQGIGDMVILRFRVSLFCTLGSILSCILGSILSCIFGFYSDPPPPVPLVPVFTGPPNYGNPGFSVAQIVFSSTTTVGFQLPSPLCKDTEQLHYRPHE